jgi:hypothetical protein
MLIHKKKRATYGELTASVIVIDTSELKEMVADFPHNEEMAHLVHETPTSPTKAICEALTTTHLQIHYNVQPLVPSIASSQTPVQVYPFLGQGGHGNLFGPICSASLLPFHGTGPGAFGIVLHRTQCSQSPRHTGPIPAQHTYQVALSGPDSVKTPTPS